MARVDPWMLPRRRRALPRDRARLYSVANLAHRVLDLLDDEVAELLAVGELVRPHRSDDSEHDQPDEQDERDVLDRALPLTGPEQATRGFPGLRQPRLHVS